MLPHKFCYISPVDVVVVVPVGGEGLPVGPSVFEPCAVVDKPGIGVVVPISVTVFWTVLQN